MVGCLAHGHESHFVLVEEDQPFGASLTIDIVARTIDSVFARCEEGGFEKLRHLWIQCDSASDNKNQTMLKFLGSLVDRNNFRSATLAFLRVGHTHEDIGQS